jgi:hypothetical protein
VCLFRRPAAIVIGHSARILVVLVGLILLVWAMAGDEDRLAHDPGDGGTT